MWHSWQFRKRHGELKKLKIPVNCPGASHPCIWFASFQEHISSPMSSQPSLPPHFSNAYSRSSFLRRDPEGSFDGWYFGAFGVFHQFHSSFMGCAQHLADASLQPQLLKPAHCSTRGELLGYWCTHWLWLVHGIFGSSGINCMGIHSCRADWVLMRKTHPSVIWVLMHEVLECSSMTW